MFSTVRRSGAPKSIYLNVLNKTLSSRGSGAVFIEKSLDEQPIIVINEDDNVDIIGPPDPVSNLRPIIRKQLLNETVLQQRLRQMQNATQEWNQKFWANHNVEYVKERQNYITLHLSKNKDKEQLTADEMSEFYKKFLDKNWDRHVKYNYEWYQRNITLLFFALRVSIEKLIMKVS